MPLNSAQQGFITDTISYLFLDLPSEEKDFLDEVEKIKRAFTQPSEEKECGELQSSLRRFIHSPQNHFRNIEKLNSSQIQTGEIQEFVHDHLFALLTRKAEEANIAIDKLAWNKENLLSTLRSRVEFNMPYQPIAAPVINNEEHAYSINPSDRIFSAFLEPKFDFRIICLHTEIKLPSGNKHITENIAEFPPTAFNTQENNRRFNNFIQELRENTALHEAENQAKSAVFEELFPTHPKEDKVSSSAKILLTYSYYYSLVAHDRSSFEPIKKINLKQLKILSAPQIILLISKNKLSIQTAMTLSLEVTKLLSHHFWYNLFYENPLILREIANVSSQQVFVLHNPAICQLIIKQKITVEKAKDISISAALILSDPYYFRLIMEDPEQLKLIQSIHPEQSNNLKSNQIKKLIFQKILTLTEATQLSKNARTLIEDNPFILFLLENRLLTSKDLEQTPEKIWARVVSIRLQAIFTGKAYIINEKQDSIDQLEPDIMKITQEKGLIINKLLKLIIKDFLTHIKDSLSSKIKEPLYSEISTKIDNADRLRDGWEKAISVIQNLIYHKPQPSTKKIRTSFFAEEDPIKPFATITDMLVKLCSDHKHVYRV
jgi:hypothetical protein